MKVEEEILNEIKFKQTQTPIWFTTLLNKLKVEAEEMERIG
jgi:hypothetical protein